ncbi:hypothetical protein BD779DRAFT_1473584 [Infundibulicybe gibba]|nr:hypothetical protein BD779DRAFT_1473584 [Infundibulicybe gibba]
MSCIVWVARPAGMGRPPEWGGVSEPRTFWNFSPVRGSSSLNFGSELDCSITRHGPRVKKRAGPYPSTRPDQEAGPSSAISQRAAEEAKLTTCLYQEVAHTWARSKDRRRTGILRRRVEQDQGTALTRDGRGAEDRARELVARWRHKGGYEFGGRGRGAVQIPSVGFRWAWLGSLGHAADGPQLSPACRRPSDALEATYHICPHVPPPKGIATQKRKAGIDVMRVWLRLQWVLVVTCLRFAFVPGCWVWVHSSNSGGALGWASLLKKEWRVGTCSAVRISLAVACPIASYMADFNPCGGPGSSPSTRNAAPAWDNSGLPGAEPSEKVDRGPGELRLTLRWY